MRRAPLIRLLAAAGVLLFAAAVLAAPASDSARIERILAQTPLIDGHNDLPWEIRARFGGDLTRYRSGLLDPRAAGAAG